MAKYISLDALEAELERLREVEPLDEFQPTEQNKHDWLAGKLYTIFSLGNFLETIEVKEIGVDVGSPEGDTCVKTIWDGDKIVSNKAQKGEEV